jgi:hypothetical protein
MTDNQEDAYMEFRYRMQRLLWMQTKFDGFALQPDDAGYPPQLLNAYQELREAMHKVVIQEATYLNEVK